LRDRKADTEADYLVIALTF